MPPGPLVLDTDVVSFMLRRSGRFREFEDLVRDHVQAISFATLGEVLAGSHAAGLGERRLADLRERLSRYVVLPFDRLVVEAWAPLYAKVKGHLHQGGVNDLWTAACALTQSPPLPVVTNNLRDFTAITGAAPGLSLVHPDL